VKVVLDTSFLLDLVKFRVEVDEVFTLLGRCELIVPDAVVEELRKLACSAGQSGRLAKLALHLIERKNMEIVESKERSADAAILSLIGKNVVVATDDRKLRQKLKSLHQRTIFIRAKKHLAID